jgi:hypothetical protein
MRDNSSGENVSSGSGYVSSEWLTYKRWRQKISIVIIIAIYILKPEDVVISRLFLFVFTYKLLWLSSLITQI